MHRFGKKIFLEHFLLLLLLVRTPKIDLFGTKFFISFSLPKFIPLNCVNAFIDTVHLTPAVENM